MSIKIRLDREKIAGFCRKWKITELALFGSVLRDDFKPHSDVDVLVTFAADAQWTLFDLAHMEEELAGIVRRKVDLISRRGIERSPNYIRKKAILSSAEVIHAA